MKSTDAYAMTNAFLGRRKARNRVLQNGILVFGVVVVFVVLLRIEILQTPLAALKDFPALAENE